MTTRPYAQVLRAVPRVAPMQPLVVSAVLAAAFVLTAPSASSVEMRLRVASAVVAAAACFVLDDDAATTTLSTPVSRLTQRGLRGGVAAAFVVAWLVLVIVAADALTGSGRPPVEDFVEVGALGLIAAAVACVSIGRTDDGRGGIVGTFAALLCFATVYLPPRWWWPLTAEPELTRLAVVTAFAMAAAAAASADPARRRRWRR